MDSERNASSPMKIDALQFIHTVLVHHPPEVAHAHVATLLPSLLSAVSDPFYKITSEALLVLQQLVSVHCGRVIFCNMRAIANLSVAANRLSNLPRTYFGTVVDYHSSQRGFAFVY